MPRPWGSIQTKPGALRGAIDPAIAAADRHSVKSHPRPPDKAAIPADHFLRRKGAPGLELDFAMHREAHRLRERRPRGDRMTKIAAHRLGPMVGRVRIEAPLSARRFVP